MKQYKCKSKLPEANIPQTLKVAKKIKLPLGKKRK